MKMKIEIKLNSFEPEEFDEQIPQFEPEQPD